MKGKTQNNGKHEGSIRKRKDGRFEGRITIDGISRSVYGKSEAECRRQIKEFKRQVAAKQINPKTDLLYDYCLKWIYKYRFNKIEPSSFDRLESVIEHQIKPSNLSKKQFGRVTSDELQELLYNLICPKSGRAYAHSTAKKVYELLSMIYKDAYNRNELVLNPMANVVMPKESRCVIKRKETFSLTPEQIKTLKSACLVKNRNGTYKYRYGLVILLMLNTGMRIGEMLALEFDKINFNAGFIRIDQSLQSNIKTRREDKKRESIIKEPKTRNSIRLLPMNEEIKFLLLEIIKDNDTRGIHSQYVCSSDNGNQGIARNIQRSLDIITNNANLPHVWLHLLRHTFGSELIRKGIDITIVSKLMGHANTTITYQKYIHAIEEETIKAMQLTSVS